MRFVNTIRSLGILLCIFSLTMIPPCFVANYYGEDTIRIFLLSMVGLLVLGLLLWAPTRNIQYETRAKEGFLVVVLFWLCACMAGAVPFILSKNPDVSYIDAFFESVSGLTATGASVFRGLDNMPLSILYYRQQLQLLGGIGIIILAVAVLPMLGAGGMQMFRAEITGPQKDNKLTPKIAQTAKAIWMIYLTLTCLCAICYWASGMILFDAICYSFGTVSTGGFAPHDESFAYFTNPSIRMAAVVFMFLGGTSFYLHFVTVIHGTFNQYWKNLEFQIYLIGLMTAIFLVFTNLRYHAVYSQWEEALIDTCFHVISLATTTGFFASNYHNWPTFIPALLLILGMIGGCSGSTSGGIKVIRVLLLVRQGIREIIRLVHPSGHFKIRLGGGLISDKLIDAIWGFLAIYVSLFVILFLSLLATGLDFLTSFSATAATLSNIGPGLGDVVRSYADLTTVGKSILCASMIIGRLELFTVLVLLTPEYWKS